jgi:hypothetical protein
MYDHSVIKDNTYVNSNSTAIGFIHIQSGTFEMHGNASIACNKWEPYISGTDAQIGGRIYATGYAAVYGVGAISFKMHDNSEISGNEMRAVYLVSNSSNYPSFTMTGGTITDNGKKTWTGSTDGIEYYVMGGAMVLYTGGQFTMTGGTITGNGVSGKPGTGIVALNSVNNTITQPFILNGSVAISDTIAFYGPPNVNNKVCLFLGPNFTTSAAIPVILFINASGVTSFKDRWPADSQFLKPLGENSVVDMNQNFAFGGGYYINVTTVGSEDYTGELNYLLDADGYIRANSGS